MVKKPQNLLLKSQAQVLSKLRNTRGSGITLKELSRDSHINVTRLFRLENGANELKISEIMLLGDFYGTDIIKDILLNFPEPAVDYYIE